MSGEGTGGGGAIAALLALWVGAAIFLFGDRVFAPEEPAVADEPDIVAVEPDSTPAVVPALPTPTPKPPPELPTCEGEACDRAVSRAHLAGAFVQVFRLPVTTRDFFTDDADVPEQAAINRVAAAGITTGCGDRAFCPDGEVTRAQMATFLDRALELAEADRDYFTDDNGLSHEGAINRVAAAGLTVGCGEERYCPGGSVTMRQLITFLERAISLETVVAQS